MSVWLNIIGVGEDGVRALPRALQQLIERAELIVGGERHLAMVTHVQAEKWPWASPITWTFEGIMARRGRPVVVLATGDPMHFGVGAALAKRFPPDEIAVYPSLSAFSLAAARMRWSLADVECLTIHGRPLDLIASAAAPNRKLLLLSHDGTSPEEIAHRLAALGYGASEITVLEHMGGPHEHVYSGRADSWSRPRAADLNTVAVICRSTGAAVPLSLAPGLPDEAFQHDGQLTKREIRAGTLSALRPLPGQLLWDVGAGCGSISIEWLRVHSSLSAFAIEPNRERQKLIDANIAALGTPFLGRVYLPAPEAYGHLPDPDAVFIGGGLGDRGVVEGAWERLKPGGRLVANAVTAEGEGHLFALRSKLGGEMARLSVARLAPVGELHGWKPLMPVTQYWVDKK